MLECDVAVTWHDSPEDCMKASRQSSKNCCISSGDSAACTASYASSHLHPVEGQQSVCAWGGVSVGWSGSWRLKTHVPAPRRRAAERVRATLLDASFDVPPHAVSAVEVLPVSACDEYRHLRHAAVLLVTLTSPDDAARVADAALLSTALA